MADAVNPAPGPGAALYEPDGDRFVPTARTTGPWDPSAQHGGAPAALLTRAVELVEAPAPVRLARVTFELLRPVPLTPLTVTTTVLRPGKKVSLVGASLLAGDVEVVRAVALRVRVDDDLVLPDGVAPDDPPPAGPPAAPGTGDVQSPPFAAAAPLVAFHTHGAEVVSVDGGFGTPGPSAVWIRLRVPVVPGEDPSPAQRVAAAADFGNGVSWVLPGDSWLFINPDLTVHLARLPVGEWIGMRSMTLPAEGGVGLAESALYDAGGRIGRSVQSLLLDRR